MASNTAPSRPDTSSRAASSKQPDDFYGLVGICLAALIFRVWTPWNIVFDGQAVRFQQIDAYYYQRLVENFLAHPPWLIFHEPYAVAGSDGAVTVAPMFAILLGLTAWISPAPATVTIAIIPAFLGAAAPAIVYFITRRLTSSGGAGLMAAAILAVLPGAWLRALRVNRTRRTIWT